MVYNISFPPIAVGYCSDEIGCKVIIFNYLLDLYGIFRYLLPSSLPCCRGDSIGKAVGVVARILLKNGFDACQSLAGALFGLITFWDHLAHLPCRFLACVKSNVIARNSVIQNYKSDVL